MLLLFLPHSYHEIVHLTYFCTSSILKRLESSTTQSSSKYDRNWIYSTNAAANNAQIRVSLHRFFLKDITSPKFREHKAGMIRKMEQYLTTTSCRRKAVLSHFDKRAESSVTGTDKCCDNCRARCMPVSTRMFFRIF